MSGFMKRFDDWYYTSWVSWVPGIVGAFVVGTVAGGLLGWGVVKAFFSAVRGLFS